MVVCYIFMNRPKISQVVKEDIFQFDDDSSTQKLSRVKNLQERPTDYRKITKKN